MIRPLTAIALLLLLGGCALFIERADYAVVERFEGFELRRYAPYIVAETVVQGDFEKVGNRAFGILAGYIGGENRGGKKISMTAPVNQRPAGGDGERIPMTAPVVQAPGGAGEGAYVLSFVMPARYTMDPLPQPTDPRVTLRRVDGGLMAAHRYSGTWSEARPSSGDSIPNQWDGPATAGIGSLVS